MEQKTSQVILATGELCAFDALSPNMKLIGENSQIHELKNIEKKAVKAFEIRPLKGTPFLIGYDQIILAKALKSDEPLLLRAQDYSEQSCKFKRSFGLIRHF